jgi:hypothetical protein
LYGGARPEGVAFFDLFLVLLFLLADFSKKYTTVLLEGNVHFLGLSPRYCINFDGLWVTLFVRFFVGQLAAK